jgi:tRNA threonylcarbamoyl adenosine modification protein YeaZ
MIVLALETSTPFGSVSVAKDGTILATQEWKAERSHSELVTVQISNCLNQAGVDLKKINALSVGRGPGSFTGIRVAINAVRSLSFVRGLPIYAFDSNKTLVGAIAAQKLPVAVFINALKNQVYASTFVWSQNAWTPELELGTYALEKISSVVKTPHLCVGDAFEECQLGLRPELKDLLTRDSAIADFPKSETLARMTFEQSSSTPTFDWNTLQPLYIRASGAEELLKESQGR